MTLKEKFDKLIVYPFSEYKEQMKILKEENNNELVKIVDNFAIGFAEWYRVKCILSSLDYHLTTKELLEMYKKEKGL